MTSIRVDIHMDIPEQTQRYTKFTIIVYPTGHSSPRVRCRWFNSETPVSWSDARDRLVKAGILDLSLAGRTSENGGWMLSVDKNDYSEEKAEALPPALS